MNMVPQINCPPDGPVVGFDFQTGEKFASCVACRRCGGCLKAAGRGLRPNGVGK